MYHFRGIEVWGGACVVLVALSCSACGGETSGRPDGAGGSRTDVSTSASTGGTRRGSGGSGAGSANTTGAGSANTTGAGTTSDWGCADNGSTCLCYEPGGQGYDEPRCGDYDCCWYADYPQGSECECVSGSCNRPNPDAKRVSSCPP